MITDKIKTRGKDLSVLEGMDRIQYLVDLAKEVKPLADKHKTDENKIRGCASNLWLVGEVNNYIDSLTNSDDDSDSTKSEEEECIFDFLAKHSLSGMNEGDANTNSDHRCVTQRLQRVTSREARAD